MAETKTARPKKRAEKTAKVVKAETPKTVKSEAVEAATVTPDAVVSKLKVELDYTDTTRRYEKFTAPDGSGCQGSLYVPLGAKSVKVLVEM